MEQDIFQPWALQMSMAKVSLRHTFFTIFSINNYEYENQMEQHILRLWALQMNIIKVILKHTFMQSSKFTIIILECRMQMVQHILHLQALQMRVTKVSLKHIFTQFSTFTFITTEFSYKDIFFSLEFCKWAWQRLVSNISSYNFQHLQL